ncbi:hypothetical protein E2562_000710 [Oryza meyeriana var. granulata]|uniref:Uncharacterized protein n=1 Tax=Oryza meyeriana var. granulata TaxID=110450 RepID=A0A6G1DUM1_9ORYZ|nr:hypothetical protein E2562_000710 [Oryza meyeriana var. granulata]
MVHKGQEELEATSNELASIVEARDNLKKELLDVYKKLESTSQELVDERKTVTTLNRELEALVKQLQMDSEARKALEADLDEATKSLDEMNKSALSLSKELEETNSRKDTLEAEKEMLSKALAEQQKITTEAHENTEDAQNLISRLQTERESFEMRSRHLEEELALAKGEILRLRRQISTSRSQKAKTLPRTNASPEVSQAPNEQPVNDNQNTSKVPAGSQYTAKRTTRRRKGAYNPQASNNNSLHAVGRGGLSQSTNTKPSSATSTTRSRKAVTLIEKWHHSSASEALNYCGSCGAGPVPALNNCCYYAQHRASSSLSTRRPNENRSLVRAVPATADGAERPGHKLVLATSPTRRPWP